MDKLHPKAVIFDLGSTLIEYEEIPWSEMNVFCAESARRFLLKKGYDVPEEHEFHRAFEALKDKYRLKAAETLREWSILTVTKELLESWQIPADDGLVEAFFDAYYQPLGKKIYMYDDVIPTLEWLRAQGVVIGLVSNTIFPERAHVKELKRFGALSYFAFTLFSSSFGTRKPHPDIFYKAANLAGYAPAECVYVGDRFLEDVQGPQEIGMPAVLKLWSKREYPEEVHKGRTISALAELREHLAFEEEPHHG